MEPNVAPVDQRFGNSEAAQGGFSFQGYVNGPVHIERTHNNYYEKEPRVGPYRLIPFPRNEDVVYRGVFDELESLLPPSTDYKSAALWGLGGSGKTQIALEFAYRRCRDPAWSIFWVHADNEMTFRRDYRSIAKRLNLADTLDGEELLEAVRNKIEAHPCWMLVLDNADNLELFGVGRHGSERESSSMSAFVPRGPTGTVLWTSRDERITGTLVGAQRTVKVSRMTPEEATKLLQTVRAKRIDDSETEDAAALLAELDWLPLAVSQAAAYLRRTLTPMAKYVSKLKSGKRRWKLLKDTEFDRHRRIEVPNSILETWSISIARIQQESELAYSILHCLAFMDNQIIPFEIIRQMAVSGKGKGISNHMTKSDADHTIGSDSDDDDENITSAITRLREFSFLSVLASEDGSSAYEMHKLVQDATRYRLSQPARREEEAYYSKSALQVVFDMFPSRRQEPWEEYEKYVIHAERVSEWAELCKGEKIASQLLTWVSSYLYDRGRWKEREAVDIRACALREKTFGLKHPKTAESTANLAATYYELGLYDKAEKLGTKVLAVRREILGENHPDTAESIANLAAIYHELGRLDDAEKMKVEVLALRRRILGNKHPDTAMIMANLMATYLELGRYEEAEKIGTEVLELRREILGKQHRDTIESMASLARIYDAFSRYNEAANIEVEVLALRREMLGENHPDTALTIANLAVIYAKLGRSDEAEKLEIEALALQREILGTKHPSTIQSMATLAAIYNQLGRYNEAEKIGVEVLELRREMLGNKHADTALSIANLAATYAKLGQSDEAEKLGIEALALQREILGEKHPDTIPSMLNLATLWNSQGRSEAAMTMIEECVELCRQVLAPDHSLALSSLDLLQSWQAAKMSQLTIYD